MQKWKEQVEKRLKTPSLSVSNYGGGAVNIISQMLVTMTHEKRECQTVVLVQTGASLELLLRTTPRNRCVSPTWLLLVRGTTC